MRDKTITISNYQEGRERMSRGEVTVPTYYYRLKRGDRAQLVKQGNKPYRMRLINGLCKERGHLWRVISPYLVGIITQLR